MNAGPEAIPPLIITKEGQIMDGGRRWRGAKQLQWERVPTIERPEHEAAALIVDTLLGQRNLPRGTKIYLAIALLPEWAKSNESRRLANLSRGVKNLKNPNVSPKKCDTSSGEFDDHCRKAIAERFGVNVDTLNRAIRVRALFEKHPHFKLEYEPELISGEKSLWNVEAAIKGALTPQPNAGNEQLEFWSSPFTALKRDSTKWARLGKENKEKFTTAWRETAAALHPDLRKTMSAVLAELDS